MACDVVVNLRYPSAGESSSVSVRMMGMGVHRSFDELAQLPREVVTYRPQMLAAQVEQFYAGWKRAVKQVLCGAESC